MIDKVTNVLSMIITFEIILIAFCGLIYLSCITSSDLHLWNHLECKNILDCQCHIIRNNIGLLLFNRPLPYGG